MTLPCRVEQLTCPPGSRRAKALNSASGLIYGNICHYMSASENLRRRYVVLACVSWAFMGTAIVAFGLHDMLFANYPGGMPRKHRQVAYP